MRVSTASIIASLFLSVFVFGQEKEVKLENFTSNTGNNELAIRKLQDAYVFVGPATDDYGNALFDPSTGEQFTDLFLVSDSGSVPLEIPNVSGDILLASSYYFDGPISSTADADLIFFTNNIISGKEKLTLGIFYAVKTELGYSDPLPFSFNSEEYNTTHPFYDEQNDVLYFSSDKEDGKGGMDIYKVKWNNGKSGIVQNQAFNSPENDVFPTVNDGKVYFSSNRAGGMGGYDLYSSQNDALLQLEAPFNSTADDVDIVWLDNVSGFITTNRNSVDANTNDDIFAFTVIENERIVSIDIDLRDADGNPIDGALITVTEDASGVIKFSALTDEFGRIKGTVDTLVRNASNGYTINIDKEGFIFQTQQLSVNAEDTSSLAINSANIDPKPARLENEMELSLALDISTIYYDFNSSKLRESSLVELDKLIAFMKKHPEVIIELGAHTDCAGSDKYNMWLSERRAKSAVNYVKSKISNTKNLISKGYGESNPVVNCNCSRKKSSCSDSENQMNRRTEFKIVEVQLAE